MSVPGRFDYALCAVDRRFESSHFALALPSPIAVDLTALLGDQMPVAPPKGVHVSYESAEVDLAAAPAHKATGSFMKIRGSRT